MSVELIRQAAKPAAPRNRTITLSNSEKQTYEQRLLRLAAPATLETILDRTINQDMLEAIRYLPPAFADLLFLDPPYNLNKSFGEVSFRQRTSEEYREWLETWFPSLLGLLKPQASVYICGDWRSAAAVQMVAEKYLIVRNRITWEREKGRGAARNWKSCAEDLWFCTRSEDYCFNLDQVKLRRRVMAPYREADGKPRDWQDDETPTRLTHPSNVWTDLTVPFWSMPENTQHPTQKPEKLLAKIILASTEAGQVVFDPFLGSGTASVVARKLGRRFVGIELDTYHCCVAEKRLALADAEPAIQGYSEGVFWERNSSPRARHGTDGTPRLRLEGL